MLSCALHPPLVSSHPESGLKERISGEALVPFPIVVPYLNSGHYSVERILT